MEQRGSTGSVHLLTLPLEKRCVPPPSAKGHDQAMASERGSRRSLDSHCARIDSHSRTRRSKRSTTTMPDLDRRRFLGSAAATVAAGQLGVLAFSRRLEAMTQPIAEVPLQASSVRGDIRPFHGGFPEGQLTALCGRIPANKWPEPETVPSDT